MSTHEKTILANHVQRGVARGGRLTIGAEKLSFRPTIIERALGKVLSIVRVPQP